MGKQNFKRNVPNQHLIQALWETLLGIRNNTLQPLHNKKA
jgi:hypothetical protein